MQRDKTTNNRATNYGWGFLVCMRKCDKRIKQLKREKKGQEEEGNDKRYTAKGRKEERGSGGGGGGRSC